MNQYYPSLLSPLKIGGKVLKNRMGMSNAAPTFVKGSDNLYPLESLVTYMRDMARNGAAIVTCPCPNWRSARSRPIKLDPKMMVPVFNEIDKHQHFPIPGEEKGFDLEIQNVRIMFSRIAEAIHGEGSLASISCMEIEPLGWDFDEIPLEYLDEMLDNFADICRLYQSLGFDICNIYMSNDNTLLAKSLSPVLNTRTDKYGGKTMRERAALTMELFRRIRKACPGMLIEAQVSGEEPMDGGYTIEDLVEYAKVTEGLIDIMHLRDRDGKCAMPFFAEPGQEPEALRYAEAIKKSGVNVITAPVTGFRFPEDNERYIAEGRADMLYMAHAFMCDSEYGQKIREGRADEIAHCLQCNKCHSMPGNPDAGCAINPRLVISMTDRERAWADKTTAPVSKKVAVVGGGPAGIVAAMIASRRGHRVTLYEKNRVLGGQLLHADHVSFKWTLRDYKDHLIHMLGKTDVDVRLNTTVSPKDIQDAGYDAVVVAAGAVPKKTGISGEDSSICRCTPEVFGREEELGPRVIVIGGSEKGAEVGLHLAKLGHRVTVLTRKGFLATDAQGIHYREYFEQAWNAEPNFSAIVHAVTTAITDAGVEYLDENGHKQFLEADSVVLNGGLAPCSDDALEFAAAAGEFYMIGDCRRIADVRSAVKDAFNTAARI